MSVALCLASAGFETHADFQGSTHLMPFDEEPILYGRSEDRGPVALLQKRIDDGSVRLEYDAKFGYLKSLLAELKIPFSSQMLVFSKTSFQRDRISPSSPRAIYFGENTYVGFIPGSPLVEISAVDSKLGTVFYTLDQTKAERPRLKRGDQCLECHASGRSMGVPGHLVRSLSTDEAGTPDLSTGVSRVDHRTPFEERWGGWYVTGTHGNQKHRGNIVGTEKRTAGENGNLMRLDSFFDVSRYPRPDSDIVALMIFEHQTHMQNFMTRLGYEARTALKTYGHVRYLKTQIDAFLKYLLFIDEARLKSPVQGNDAFRKEFTAQGPRDQKGRSLRELDLNTRLFKFPCSYLIYSKQFDALPGLLKEQIYSRLREILSGNDPDFATPALADRAAILEILHQTKSDFALKSDLVQAAKE